MIPFLGLGLLLDVWFNQHFKVYTGTDTFQSLYTVFICSNKFAYICLLFVFEWCLRSLPKNHELYSYLWWFVDDHVEIVLGNGDHVIWNTIKNGFLWLLSRPEITIHTSQRIIKITNQTLWHCLARSTCRKSFMYIL